MLFDAMLKVAEQAAEDLPAIGAAELKIALQIDADDAVGMNARGFEFVAIKFIRQHDREELLAGQFDESHVGHRCCG